MNESKNQTFTYINDRRMYIVPKKEKKKHITQYQHLNFTFSHVSIFIDAAP